MLNSSKIIGFVATRDRERARAFYGGTLGLKLSGEDPYALVFDANGTMIRVQLVRELVPAGHTQLGWQVADIRAVAAKLMTQGVTFERVPGLAQDDLGIWDSPSGAKVAWFRDPEGNILSLTQFPAAPKPP